MKTRIARFIVLDIETDIPHPKGATDLSNAFLVGMKSFSLVKGELKAEKYRMGRPFDKREDR